MKLLAGKVAIVTGAGCGIGSSTALMLAQAGAGLVVSDIRQAAADATADLIWQSGGQAIALAADIGE